MARKKVKKRKIKYVDGDGVEHILDNAIEITLGGGTSIEDLVEEALNIDEDDEVIKQKAKEIETFLKKNADKNALKKWYDLGQILQFVNELNLNDEASKKEAFRRLFLDLNVDTIRNPALEKIVRYPYHMYILSRIPQEMVFRKGMTWSKWFDILEYKAIVNNSNILNTLVKECCEKNWSSSVLRKKLQALNKKLKSKNFE